MIKLASKLFGSSNDRAIKALQQHVEPINALETTYEAMSDTEIKEQTDVLRKRIQNGETLDDIMHDAFAVVRESAKRSLGQRHYDEQLLGGICLHQGKISEMKTGEGKTLVATLAVYLNALSGQGVHVVTVNDYLAKRDSEWMGQVYEFLGLTTGCILGGMYPDERRAAYHCDVTYGTNNEFGFDYLRDNMRFQLDKMVQRPFNFAIIDEVDSILIDEARTPLIISGPSEVSTELYISVDKMIPNLVAEDYELDEKHKSVMLTEEGTLHIETLLREHGILSEGNLYDMQNINLVHHANQALRAHKLFHIDKDYIIYDSQVMLIDEFTGRMMDGRRLSEGLHQAIEAKENVEIQSENQTLASITFQNYFRLYPKLAGMTGTAMTEAGEFMEIYKLGVIALPTHVPVQREDAEDQIFKSMAEKEMAIVELIKECQNNKQPVLVGTVSIEKSESLSALLKKKKIKHNVLNARHHEQEAYIVSQAGHLGAVTIATNMAGRGTDIQLGGNVDMLISEQVDESWDEAKKKKVIKKITDDAARDKKIALEAGGLKIIGTERHESRRIDNQLRGRSGRQGDPGSSIFFLSVEDDLMRVFAGDRLESLLSNSKIGLQDGEALEHPMISKMLERAQAKVESMNFDIRKNLLKYDDVMNDQRKVIYEQRREIMESENISELVTDMRHDIIEDLVAYTIPANVYAEKWNTEALRNDCMRLLGLDLPIAEWAKEEGIADNEILERIIDAGDKKMAAKATNHGVQLWHNMEKHIVLQTLDQHWKEHLLNLDHLRQGINLRALGQRDPLNEYKTEAFTIFAEMLTMMRENTTQTLNLVEVSMTDEGLSMFIPRDDAEAQIQEGRADPASMKQISNKPAEKKRGADGAPNITKMRAKKPFDKTDPSTWAKTQRNAPCPCESGKKYKQCHGKIGSVA